LAEIIDINEIRRARSRGRLQDDERKSLRRAVDLMQENLADVAMRLRDASPPDQPELLARVEKLAAMIRYGMQMLDEIPPAPDAERHVAPRPG
jgi:hypothetical protein